MTILLGVGGTVYNNHMLEPIRSLVLSLKELRNLLPSFIHILSITQPSLSMPDALLLSITIINSHYEPVSGQACAILFIPIDFF
jgi:hypothetical protein